ncbi:winged helix-turn-helix transcriptional regulator [Priestia endophytica]|jgi:DNA-binding HxlR family transcriptional regulator|uniref:Transcriptional regulator, HxlR family n=1 Tax=Priestia endophytica DSM 13796 TaxID=1121089 RepID=A0A1I6BQ74_9BACI|nr:helix-turn-helix domain-containing protein [Priestia endophytica]KAB2491519.1 helix-turn-helix transcriptional regulator [Priestia endophytica]KYG28646.1 MarR family transcriptional regulator [Priestia endophytica]MBG9811952.1 MarR family transcriptional regulator [Priestia endophytica]MCM3540407.1 helix-turn-helix transcriptional regulator [Priestia endophytica]MED4071519.1 helix-turn-helix domain-containing protein [Priestia endophytica]
MNEKESNLAFLGRYSCPVEATVDVIGGKWKSVIVYHLLDGTKRFNELKRLNKGITQRMLTLQLRELEASGIVHREIYRQIPPKVEYSLTEFGRSLEPLILFMRNWGLENMEKVLENREKHETNQS